eukprot:gene7407-9360_t
MREARSSAMGWEASGGGPSAASRVAERRRVRGEHPDARPPRGARGGSGNAHPPAAKHTGTP